MQVSDFDFDLPDELIAQEPPAERGTSRLMRLDRATGATTLGHIADLADWLRSDDVLVVNDTKVFPARLVGRRHPGGGRIECLLVRRVDQEDRTAGRQDGRAGQQDGRAGPQDDRTGQQDEWATRESGRATGAPDTGEWEALVHPGQRIRRGTTFVIEGGDGSVSIDGEVVGRDDWGRRTVRLVARGAPLDEAIERVGHVPLPPYIRRDDRPADRERYQTVFSRARGSVAAPTAGLHFTPALLEAIAARGITRVPLTHHVGYGTFKPVRTEDVEAHTVDAETYTIDEAAASTLTRARADGRRIVAVGTTTTRALESAVRVGDGAFMAGRATTDLFLYPGVPFLAVGGLVTNFHVPRSSLLFLVCAFAGREHVLAAYRRAVAERWRFYSYGDAMFIE